MQPVPISVVIPAYNSERFIGEAIESVKAQTLPVAEIIVVDNNCTDNTRNIAVSKGAKIVIERRQSVSAARNRGIDSCENEWIAFLDSDDIWEERKIEYQWKVINRFPDARIISCDSGLILEPDNTKRPVPILNEAEFKAYIETTGGEVYSYAPHFTAKLLEWFFVNSSTVIFQREVFSAVGLFDESIPYGQDLEFTARALARFPTATIKRNLAFIRRHDQNRTYDLDAFRKHKLLVAARMQKFPDEYPPGMADYFIEFEKKLFLEKARALNRSKRNQDQPKSS